MMRNLNPFTRTSKLLEEKTDEIAKVKGCDRGTFTVCWAEYEDGLSCKCKEEARKIIGADLC
jgi:hypothetical protein